MFDHSPINICQIKNNCGASRVFRLIRLFPEFKGVFVALHSIESYPKSSHLNKTNEDITRWHSARTMRPIHEIGPEESLRRARGALNYTDWLLSLRRQWSTQTRFNDDAWLRDQGLSCGSATTNKHRPGQPRDSARWKPISLPATTHARAEPVHFSPGSLLDVVIGKLLLCHANRRGESSAKLKIGNFSARHRLRSLVKSSELGGRREEGGRSQVSFE